MGFHNAITTGGIHVVANWTYANAAARTGASGFVSADIGKFAWQQDNNSFWVLTATTPTWAGISGLSNPMTSVGDVIIGGTAGAPTRLALGANTYVLTSNGTTVVWAASGGGSSPYTVPLTANFTAVNTPTGCTVADTTTGMTVSAAASATLMYALQDNTAPSSTFTITAGFNATTNLGGADGGHFGLYVMDAAGKLVSWCSGMSNAYNTLAGIVSYWTNYTTYSSNKAFQGMNFPYQFYRLEYDGTNFHFYNGADLNALVLCYTISATDFISTPTQVGIVQWADTAANAGTYFHYLHGA